MEHTCRKHSQESMQKAGCMQGCKGVGVGLRQGRNSIHSQYTPLGCLMAASHFWRGLVEGPGRDAQKS